MAAAAINCHSPNSQSKLQTCKFHEARASVLLKSPDHRCNHIAPKSIEPVLVKTAPVIITRCAVCFCHRSTPLTQPASPSAAPASPSATVPPSDEDSSSRPSRASNPHLSLPAPPRTQATTAEPSSISAQHWRRITSLGVSPSGLV